MGKGQGGGDVDFWRAGEVGARKARTITEESRRRAVEEKYKEFLTAIINLAIDEDTNIQIIRTLSPILKATINANIPCTDEEKEDLFSR